MVCALIMKVLITGVNGLLGGALRQRAVEHECTTLDHAEFDLTKPDQMAARLSALRPDVVINTAAWNAVDRCETERDVSWAVNAEGPKALAQLCTRFGTKLVHYGTDYVFDGAKRVPYVETDAPRPLNHYAAGKLAGERAVLADNPRHLVLRTSWLFGHNPAQPKSYVHTVMRQALAAKPLRAVTDQTSVPTWAPDLANWTFRLLDVDASGLLHAVNDEGVSRWEWTIAILEEARRTGLLAAVPEVEPVTTDYFSPGMKRPTYTVLDNHKAAARLGHSLGTWRKGLAELLREPIWPKVVNGNFH
jgi:dTDP-4-dehydrorhamnose reductase